MRAELKFQNHIIDSYREQGGYAQKWASEFQAGKPDLVCSLPGFGVHLVEVKHVPEWEPKCIGPYVSKLTKLQRIECRKYEEAGGLVLAFVVCGGPLALGTSLLAMSPIATEWCPHKWPCVKYKAGLKYDVVALVREYRNLRRR